MAHDLTPPATEERRLRWPVVLSAVTGVVASAAFAASMPNILQARENAPRGYSTAREMAEAIGCADTYTDTVSAGPTSAGECRLSGELVVLRTFRNQREALAWHDGVVWAAETRPFGGIGLNYVVQTDDAATMAAVSEAMGP